MWIILSLFAGVMTGAANNAGPAPGAAAQTAAAPEIVAEAAPAAPATQSQAQTGSSNVIINGGQAGASPNVIINGVPANAAPQPVPTGKFMTTAEVKPIFDMTRANWIAVREFNGKDLIYVTQIWSWRCGLSELHIQINGGGFANWPLPACHEKYAQPNVILEEDGQPYASRALGSVQSVDIRLIFKDGSTDMQNFLRGNVLIP
jgi:hypothetical protein